MVNVLGVITEVGLAVPCTALVGLAVKELISIRERLAKMEQQLKDISERCPDCKKK